MSPSKSKNKKQKTPTNLKGIISLNKKGVGYLNTDHFKEDIEIQPEKLNTALNKDRVEIEIEENGKRKTRKQGRVREVIERSKTKFVGEIKKEGKKTFFSPDDEKVYVKFRLSGSEANQLEERAKVVVEIKEWKDNRKKPKGEIVEVLGKAGEHEAEMTALVYEHGFILDFPKEAEDQAKQIQDKQQITEEAKKVRKDFREVTTFTIDPETAKDFDDAISLQKHDDGTIEVGVHIADVSHYVEKGSPIDKEAHERGTSIYLVDRTIPMLPLPLSEDVCSLNPEEEKLAFSGVFVLDENGWTKSKWFGETLVRSDKRFSYKEAQRVIDAGSGDFFHELNTLNNMAQKLRGKRVQKGSIAFGSEEVGFELNEDGFPRKVYIKPALETNELIEEFMLLANREIAKYMYDFCRKNPKASFIYRVHENPDPQKIEELATYVKALGYEFETNDGEVTPKELNQLFDKIEGTPQESLIKTAAIKAMSKAVYSIHNIGHFGLSFSKYTHFTSPIRRYPDLQVHRLVKKRLKGEKFTGKEEKQLDHIAKHSSEKELAAVNAERDSIEQKQVEYMSKRVGEEFVAVVSGVTEYGLFVTEKETKASGLIRMNQLGDDYFKLDQKNFKVTGTKKGKEFALGDEIKVRLTEADIEAGELDFTLVEKDSSSNQ